MKVWSHLTATTGCIAMALFLSACGESKNPGGDGEAESTTIRLMETIPVSANPSASGGTIIGAVRFDGAVPTPRTFVPNKDTEICGTAERTMGDLIVGGGLGIQNVIVSLADFPEEKMDVSVEAMVDQQGCVFNPRVVRVAAGAPLVFLNNDNIFHNIHTKGQDNPPLNKAQPGFMKRIRETFSEPELFEVACDVHSWMKGWVVVQEHSHYAVTDSEGAFVLPNVPPGSYVLKVWHETLGSKSLDVTVVDGQSVSMDFALSE
ncbi:MAG: hypothetical protein HOH43_22000 [Candidatus Latescibacteria bacterium]|nr:hypothetical protein [Candidatus Latescibacterota bacterium]